MMFDFAHGAQLQGTENVLDGFLRKMPGMKEWFREDNPLRGVKCNRHRIFLCSHNGRSRAHSETALREAQGTSVSGAVSDGPARPIAPHIAAVRSVLTAGTGSGSGPGFRTVCVNEGGNVKTRILNRGGGRDTHFNISLSDP